MKQMELWKVEGYANLAFGRRWRSALFLAQDWDDAKLLAPIVLGAGGVPPRSVEVTTISLKEPLVYARPAGHIVHGDILDDDPHLRAV